MIKFKYKGKQVDSDELKKLLPTGKEYDEFCRKRNKMRRAISELETRQAEIEGEIFELEKEYEKFCKPWEEEEARLGIFN